MPENLDPESLRAWRGFASLAWLVILLSWESVAPCFHEFTGWRDRGRHGVRNLVLGWLNGFATAVMFAWLWRWCADWAQSHHFGLLHGRGDSWPGWFRVPIALLLFDVWTYGWHRAVHRVPVLWRFHRMHHSDPQMDVTTANRFHPGEILASSVLRLAVIPLLGLRFGEVVLYETLLQFLVQLQHANVALPASLEKPMRALFITPILHKIHHSRDQPETDSNYGSLFSFWDRLFRSYRLRSDPGGIRFGLHGHDDPGHQTLGALWNTPWTKARPPENRG